MGASRMLQAMEPTTAGRVRSPTHAFVLDDGFFLDFAELLRGRIDPSEGVSLDWIDGYGAKDPPTAKDCFPPDEIIASVTWVHETLRQEDLAVRKLWEALRVRRWRQPDPEPYSADTLTAWLSPQVDRIIEYCETARENGHLILCIWVL